MDLNLIIQHINAANAANLRGDYSVALGHCRQVIRAQPDMPEAWYNQGVARRGQGNIRDAIESQRKALSLSQNSADALNAVGLEFIELGLHPDAEKCLNMAIALAPNHTYALSNKALLLQKLTRYEEAEKLLKRAISIQPNFAPFHANLGAILNKRTHFADAEAALKKALELAPQMPEAWNNMANAKTGQGKLAEAEAACRNAISLNPMLQDAYSNLGDILRENRRYAEAAETYAKLYALAPNFDFLKGRLLYSQMQCCDWRQFGELLRAVNTGVSKHKKAADPFGYQAISESTHDLLNCARVYAAEIFPSRPAIAPKTGWKPQHSKIRVGYLCGEFRTQATSILMAGLFEHHDKSRFTISAFDNGKSDHSELRSRIEKAFDEIVDISELSDEDASQAIAEREIDILINLNGYFGKGRQGIFSRRPAPIQVNYLGFPGTIGADYIDYLIADQTVIPEESSGDYAEKLVYLPDSYQANDSSRIAPDATISRSEAGLPPDAFVFCCFNNSYKILPSRFDLWMSILKKTDQSVLWLLEDNPSATTNLQLAAAARGVSPQRLVFGKRLPLDEHLARHKLADLFIDTLPYNAHTTASDALWAGLPVLTQTGKTFPGRVATSLLKAVGLPELITESEAEYEALAIELATNPIKLQAIKTKLENNRLTMPLFDTAGFTRHIESAFTAMFDRQQAGLPPEHIRIGQPT